jgi:hypothetical protein
VERSSVFISAVDEIDSSSSVVSLSLLSSTLVWTLSVLSVSFPISVVEDPPELISSVLSETSLSTSLDSLDELTLVELELSLLS